MAPTLYSFNESGNSYKVRLLAALLGIKLQVREIDYMGGGHKAPDFLAINPKGTLPTLTDGDDLTLTDSAAILVYLAGGHPESGYWSTDTAEQAQIVEWLAFAASNILVGVTAARNILSFAPSPEKIDRTALEQAQAKGVGSLEILEKHLEDKEWLCVGRPTIADVAVFPYVAMAPMGNVSLEPYPKVKEWIGRIEKLPRFIPMFGLDDPDYRKRLNGAGKIYNRTTAGEP